jgi:DNA adenine methylase
MKYLGSKRSLAKYLLPHIKRKPGQIWVEPFVGGANMIDKVGGKRVGADICPYLIALLKAIQSGWIPPSDISVELYKDIKNNKQHYPDELVGFVGYACSFGAKFFGGYARNSRGINYAKEAINSFKKQDLSEIKFICEDYKNLNMTNCLIYCDPPYKGTTKYKSSINHDEFFDWCKKQSKTNDVYISELDAPFECIFEMEVKSNLKKGRVEKLFKA